MRLLSGNEAVARGAWEAGVAVAAAYPGTPSTEILKSSHASPTSTPNGPPMRRLRWMSPSARPAKYNMVPANARPRHAIIEARLAAIAEFAETYSYNRVEAGDKALGIITAGVSYQYAREVFPTASILKLGMTWPLPLSLIRRFAGSVDRLIVVEELDPFIEEAVKLMGVPCEGKSIFPITGELDPRVVRECAIGAGLLPATARIPIYQHTNTEEPELCKTLSTSSSPAWAGRGRFWPATCWRMQGRPPATRSSRPRCTACRSAAAV